MIFGIHGKAGAGKDTIGLMIQKLAGYQPHSFGEAIYREVAQAFQVSQEYLADRCIKEQPQAALSLMHCGDNTFLNLMLEKYAAEEDSLTRARSPRWVLQQWGTEYRRNEDPEYWIKKALPYLIDGTVWTDVRVEKEAALLRWYGATMIFVTKPGLDEVLTHSTEMGLKAESGDIHIANDGDLSDLERKVEGILTARNLLTRQSRPQGLSL